MSDVPQLAKLGAATFAGTFQHLYSRENLTRFLEQYHSEAFYGGALSARDQKIIVADENGALVGYALLKPNSLPCDPPREEALELSRLYLLQTHRSKGIGHELMDAGLTYSQAKGYNEITLSVYSENYGAHKFYERYGFSKIGDYGFVVGDHIDAEWIMLKTF